MISIKLMGKIIFRRKDGLIFCSQKKVDSRRKTRRNNFFEKKPVTVITETEIRFY